MRHLATGIVLFILFTSSLVSCHRSEEQTESEPLHPDPQGATISPPPIDWNVVTPISRSESMDVQLRLVRYIDHWHQGRMPTITVRYAEESRSIVDQVGNQLSATPSEWKGLVDSVRNSREVGERGYMAFRTAPGRSFHDDGLGDVPRHVYHISVAGETLVFQWVRKYNP